MKATAAKENNVDSYCSLLVNIFSHISIKNKLNKKMKIGEHVGKAEIVILSETHNLKPIGDNERKP